MPRIDTLWYDLEARTQGFDSSIARSKTALGDFTAYIKANPVAALAGLAASISAVSVKMSKMAADFEYEMRKVQVIVKGTSDDLRVLSDGVLDLYQTASVGSLNELTTGLQDIVGAGIEAGKSLEFLRVATEAAVGGATTVDVATSALLTLQANYARFGLTVEDISDKLFRAVDVGRMTFAELASSIGAVAPLTAQYNISLDDLLGTLAQLTVNGLSTAESVTAMRGAITSIINPTGRLAQEFPKLAAAFTADRLQRDGFVQFLRDFNREAKASGAELQALFSDVRGLIGVLSILGDEGVGAAEKMESMATSAGATRDAFNEMSSSAKALNQEALNGLKASMIDLGESLLPWWNGILLKVIETIDEKRGAILRLKAAMQEVREFQASELYDGQLSLARRALDPSQGGTANLFSSRLFAGTPFAGARSGLLTAEALLRNPAGLGKIDENAKALAVLLQQFEKAGREAFAGMSVADMERLAGEMERLQRRLPKGKDAEDVTALARGLRASAEAARTAADQAERMAKYFGGTVAADGTPTGNTGAGVDPAAAAKARADALAALLRDMRQVAAVGRELTREMDRAWDAVVRFGEAQEDWAVGETATKVDDLDLALRRYIVTANEARKADPLGFDEAAHQRRLAAMRDQIEMVRGLENVQATVATAEKVMDDMARRRSEIEADGGIFAPTKAEMNALEFSRQTMRFIADDARRSGAERKLAEQELLRINALIAAEKRRQNKDQAEGAKGARDAVLSLLESTLAVSRGALSAANAFGLMGDSAARTAQEVANMADGLAKVIAKPGDIAGWVQTVGAGINLAASALGITEAREEKARREENTRAVEALKSFNDVLEQAVERLQQFTGNQMERLGRGIDYLVSQTSTMAGGANVRNIEENLRAFGSSWEEAKAIAEANNIAWDDTVDTIRKLQEAMRETAVQFAEFGTSMSEWRAYTDLYAKAFGIEKGTEGRFMDVLNAGSVGSTALGERLMGAFAGGGLGALREEIQKIVEIMAPGGAGLGSLIGDMNPQQFRAYIAELLDAIGALEDELAPKIRTAAEQLTAALASLELGWLFGDVTDPAKRMRDLTAAVGEMDPALAALADGLDLATTEGLATFSARLADFAKQVDERSVEIAGFTRDELLEALKAWKSGASDAAAEITRSADATKRATEAQAAYTRSLEDDLRVRRLRAGGMDDEADLAALEIRHKREREEAESQKVSAELMAEILDVQRLERIATLQSQAARDQERAASATGPSSVIARAGAASVDTLIGIANSGLALDRERNALLSAVARALTVGASPAVLPPLASAVYGAQGHVTTGSGGVVVHQSVAFYGPVTGVDEVRAGVSAGGQDIAASLQRKVDEQRRVEGRAEVM